LGAAFRGATINAADDAVILNHLAQDFPGEDAFGCVSQKNVRRLEAGLLLNNLCHHLHGAWRACGFQDDEVSFAEVRADRFSSPPDVSQVRLTILGYGRWHTDHENVSLGRLVMSFKPSCLG